MTYHVFWTDGAYRKIREADLRYPETQSNLVAKLGRELLDSLRENAESADEDNMQLQLVLTDRAAVISGGPGRVLGTVVVEDYPGASTDRIITGLLSDDDFS